MHILDVENEDIPSNELNSNDFNPKKKILYCVASVISEDLTKILCKTILEHINPDCEISEENSEHTFDEIVEKLNTCMNKSNEMDKKGDD